MTQTISVASICFLYMVVGVGRVVGSASGLPLDQAEKPYELTKISFLSMNLGMGSVSWICFHLLHEPEQIGHQCRAYILHIKRYMRLACCASVKATAKVVRVGQIWNGHCQCRTQRNGSSSWQQLVFNIVYSSERIITT